MEQDLVNIVMLKDYQNLSDSERKDLSSWCSNQEEFDQMKQVFLEVERIKDSDRFTPKQSTKDSLDDLFIQKHSKTHPTVWYNTVLVALYPKEKPAFQRPLIQIAAIAMIVLLVYPFMNDFSPKEQNQQIAKVEDAKSMQAQEKTNTNVMEPTEQSNPAFNIENTTTESEELQPFQPMMTDDFEASKTVASMDEDLNLSEMTVSAESAVFDHPDGIFLGNTGVQYSQSANEQPGIFDLLTAAF